MEAPTHIKSDEKIIFGHFLTALNWQHIEKELNEVPKGVFNFCMQEEVQKEIIRNAETELFFNGIGRGEFGIVDLLSEVFKIRSKIWWLQNGPQNIVIYSTQISLLK